jgi:K+ transporter
VYGLPLTACSSLHDQHSCRRPAAVDVSTLPAATSTAAAAFCRLPGLGIIYTQATSGIPAVLQHLLVNMPALHEVTVLLTVRIIPRPYASQEERFLVRRSKSLAGIFRVIVRCVCLTLLCACGFWRRPSGPQVVGR